MRTRLFLASAAALFAATPASAAVTFFPGATGPLPGETTIATFDGGNNGPLTTCTNCVFQNNSDADGAIPAFGSAPTTYLSVTTNGLATFTAATPWNTVSFVYGSADLYNELTVVFNGGASSQTFNGSQLIGGPATGSTTSTATNGLVYLYGFTGGITRLEFRSSQNSFEIDNLRINAVPEPGTWAMMLLGFGAVGYAMRRRKPLAVPQMA